MKKKIEYDNIRDRCLLEYFQKVIQEFDFNKVQVAKFLGISDRNMRYLMCGDKVQSAPRYLKFGSKLWLVEKQIIEEVLLQSSGNKLEASRKLGISPTALRYKLKDHKRYDSGLYDGELGLTT